MRRRIGGIVLACALFGTSTGQGQSPVDPREILRDADKAARELREVVYDGRCWASGAMTSTTPHLSGRVAMRRGGKGNLTRMELRYGSQAGGEPRDIILATDGRMVTLVDNNAKIFAREPLPKGQILLNAAGAMLMTEFYSPAPFRDELAARDVRYEGEENVAGEACRVVTVNYADETGSRARWYFSAGDHLPRRVERTMSSPQGETTLHLEILSLNSSPKLDDAVFQLGPPPGYQVLSGEKWSGFKRPPGADGRGPSSAPASAPASTTQPGR